MQVLTVENLSKRYALDGGSSGATSFRELVSGAWSRLSMSPAGRRPAAAPRELWALRDVTFDIAEGTRLGVIGRNGAGKSTLLKVLSRITEPTRGCVNIYGRTASLLEIGTGFHPDLSGRENIFLNGALLGMDRMEIKRKLDQIVDFAEIEPFLDTPVKHYSSGMYVRLGFAIAAHVDPDILILDEVLAVGDLAFQRKCFGKMEELGAAARSVIFVSHDLSAVASLCDRCIVLDHGRILFDGATSEAVLRYYEFNPVFSAKMDHNDLVRRVGDPHAHLLGAGIESMHGARIREASLDQPFKVVMRYWLSGDIDAPAVPNMHFHTAEGVCAFVAVAPGVTKMPAGEYTAEVVVPGRILNEGVYSVGLALTTFARTHYNVHFFEQKALMINLRDPRDNETLRYGYAGDFPGAVRPNLEWSIRKVEQ